MAPRALLDDGRLDLLAIHDVQPSDFRALLEELLDLGSDNRRFVHYLQVQSGVLEFEREFQMKLLTTMKTSFKSPNEIKEDLARYPSDTLAIGRTVLANDRTLLGFLRTALGLLGGGIGLVSYLKHPVIVVVGWMSVAISVVLLVWGIRRYLQIRGIMIELSRRNK